MNPHRDPEHAQRLLDHIHRLAAPLPRPLRIMEFCGGHTHSLYRHGLPQLLPDTLQLIHGPGCPVCLLPPDTIERAIELAHEGALLATFGDALRVPSRRGSLQQARAAGADIHVVYAPSDALQLARRHPHRPVVLLAIGFETTMPATAHSLQQAARQGLRNFRLLCAHLATPPLLAHLLRDPHLHLDGLIAPGHVATVTGLAPFRPAPRAHRIPTVVAGFEPLDLLLALLLLLRQHQRRQARLQNAYRRAVRRHGNPRARALIDQVFQRPTATDLGDDPIQAARVHLRPAYRAHDAGHPHPTPAPRQDTPCRQVLLGHLAPADCPHLGHRCTPEHPLGAPMVSGEGACAAYHRYRLAPC